MLLQSVPSSAGRNTFLHVSCSWKYFTQLFSFGFYIDIFFYENKQMKETILYVI